MQQGDPPLSPALPRVQVQVRMEGNLTEVGIGSTITVAAFGRPIIGAFPPSICTASATITGHHLYLPPPRVFFTDRADAERFLAATRDWIANPDDTDNLRVDCEYRLLPAGSSLPLPDDGAAHVPTLDELVYLTAYWAEATKGRKRR